MGFFDSILKSAERAATRAVARKVTEVVTEKVKEGLDNAIPTGGKPAANQYQAPVNQSASPYDTIPDLPRSFAHKAGWLCIKASSPEQVIEGLGLKNPKEANWESGILETDRNFMTKAFVSPEVNGYILVIGYIPFGVMRSVDMEIAALDKAAASFSEMSCFATQSVVDLHVWARYINGQMVRGYGWIGERGEIYLNRGNISAEEAALGYVDFITDTDCDWETARFPDTDNVHAMAKAWGIAPDLSNMNGYQTGTGFICDLK